MYTTRRYTFSFRSSDPKLTAKAEDRPAPRGSQQGVLCQWACFDGGQWGGHDLVADDPKRVAAHWAGYCEANGAIGDCSWSPERVGYGLIPPDPDSLHWGARAIYRDGTVDLLWDRAGVAGRRTQDDTAALLQWLNSRGLPWLRAHCELSEDCLGQEEDREVMVEGDGFRLVANPRASHGYLYLVAYPCPSATGRTPKPITKRAAQRRRAEMSRLVRAEIKELREQSRRS